MAKSTCAIADCERPATKRRWCGMHYQRGKADGTIKNQTAEERAWSRVQNDVPPCPNGARLIPLSDGASFTLVDEDDYDWLIQFGWWLHADGYAYRHAYSTRNGHKTYKSCVLMHRSIMETPDGMDTDHINRNRLDNRRTNLRITDRTQNNFNTGLRRTNTSGVRGVSWSKRHQLWRAYIGGTKTRIELGWFKSKDDAIAARMAAEEKMVDKCA